MTQVRDSRLLAFWAVLRPQHWIKNGFVLAPLLFSRQFHDATMCLKTLLAFVSFCAISSAIYAINDLCDRREDQQHPIKKHRPIASGAVTTSEAIIITAVLVLLSFVIGWFLGGWFMLVVLLYAVVNTVYSLGIKHLVILDVMAIAAGFVLRILGGSVAIAVAPSHWLVLCTIMISVFLGFTKRRAELVSAHADGQHARMVLKDYSIGFLDQVISMVTGATIICYALYTVDARTLQVFDTRAMLLTVPSVMYGMFRYVYIIYHLQEGEDPTRAIIRDIPTIINLIIWVVISLLVVNYGRSFDLFD